MVHSKGTLNPMTRDLCLGQHHRAGGFSLCGWSTMRCAGAHRANLGFGIRGGGGGGGVTELCKGAEASQHRAGALPLSCRYANADQCASERMRGLEARWQV